MVLSKERRVYFLLAALVSLAVILSACQNFIPVQTYDLNNVYADPKDIKTGYDLPRRSSVCFDVMNNGATTLSPRIEIFADKKCFESTSIKEIGAISPEGSVHSCVDVYIPYDNARNDAYKLACVGKNFQINVSLQDISGTKLDEGTTSIGIV